MFLPPALQEVAEFVDDWKIRTGGCDRTMGEFPGRLPRWLLPVAVTATVDSLPRAASLGYRPHRGRHAPGLAKLEGNSRWDGGLRSRCEGAHCRAHAGRGDASLRAADRAALRSVSRESRGWQET